MTTLPPPVSALEVRLGLAAGTLADEDLARASAALEDATALALAEVSEAKATAWAASAPSVVALVVIKAARREFDNPRGVQQETQGDHSVGLTDTSGVYLTGREVSLIQRAASGRRSGAYSVRTPSAYGSDR